MQTKAVRQTRIDHNLHIHYNNSIPINHVSKRNPTPEHYNNCSVFYTSIPNNHVSAANTTNKQYTRYNVFYYCHYGTDLHYNI
ncbi:unnamed protein product [Mesocestoides corti]|uniref:Uncharacterized protein n=1 Tax=Mesocestoides corti TaxID=53468 RepID=A0A0R3UP04_MESCO|nr:unnamed protein product [Mesocestoides corti]